MEQQEVKFEVKVGKKFEGEITILVEDVRKTDFSLMKAAAYVLVAAILAGTVASVAYGVVTGDYSVTKGVAEITKELVEVVVSAALKAKE
jgi:hypothetical protein